jgi:hypothetical protein
MQIVAEPSNKENVNIIASNIVITYALQLKVAISIFIHSLGLL